MDKQYETDELSFEDLDKVLGAPPKELLADNLDPEIRKMFREKQLEELRDARQILTGEQNIMQQSNKNDFGMNR